MIVLDGTFITHLAPLVRYNTKIDIDLDRFDWTDAEEPTTLPTEVSSSPAESAGNAIKNATTDSINVSGEMDKIRLLKEYKDLMDAGIVTQEEFEAKKKELLGLV